MRETVIARAMIFYYLGKCFISNKDYQKPLDCFNKALKEFISIGDYKMQVNINLDLASLYEINKDYSNSLTFYNRCLDLLIKMSNDTQMITVSRNKMIELTNKKGDYDRLAI